LSKQAVALIAALLVAGLLVVGCGGDDNDDASAGSPGAETTSAGGESAGGDGSEESGSGSQETDSGDGETLTKATFIGQGDAICAGSQKRITAEGTQFFKQAQAQGDQAQPGNESEEIQIELIETILLPEYERVAEELSALGLPDGDAQAEAVVDSYVAFSEAVGEDPSGYLKKGPGVESYEETKRLAKAYGFKECPQGV
jgi:hypothetical protein